jgi:hypothetical protein
MSLRAAILCCAALFAVAALADDNPVYESLDGVEIGRVFLSRQERAILDRKRAHGADAGASTSGAIAAQTASPAASSAGYFIGRNGDSKVWKNGDFVTSQGTRETALKFPGAVKVRRHEAEKAADKPDDAEALAEPDD